MKKRLISTCILIAYSAVLIKVMVFKDISVIRIGSLMLNFGGTHEGPANLMPFKTILPYLLGEKGFIIAVINLVGNVVLLIPLGFLAPFVHLKMTWKKSLALAAAAGLTIEGMQVVLHVGIFDIDDVILNGVGVMVGYWVFTILPKMVHSMKSKKIIITSIIIVSCAVACFVVSFYQKSHLPVSFGLSAENSPSDRFDNTKGGIPQNCDPCNGTGGTGQIVSVGNNTITIKRRDGVNQIIILTDQTRIRTSAGSIAESDLKLGDRVTVVVPSNNDGSMTATIVLVCNAPGAEPAK